MKQSQVRSRDGSRHVTDERINTITHLVAACCSLLVAAYLINQALLGADVWTVVGMSVYGLSLILLFIFSTLHHGINGSKTTNAVLRTLDYDAVFLLIAGTVTPIVLVFYRQPLGWIVLSVVWAIAVVGISLRSALQQLPKYITNTLYIVLGWLPLVLILADPSQMPLQAVILLGLGGVIYSLGFIMYSIEKPNIIAGRFGFHELWHICVAIAAGLHAWAMLGYVVTFVS